MAAGQIICGAYGYAAASNATMNFSLSNFFRRALPNIRRNLAEKVGYGKYSHPALNGLDRKLEKYLNKDGGFFVEAGANDGLLQSNTYYFEKIRSWRGILIEPIPDLARRCARRRKNSTVINAALVSLDFEKTEIEITYAGLMSAAREGFETENAANEHFAQGRKVQNLDRTYAIKVPAVTLTSILDKFASNQRIDLLSLDVEGYEPQVLNGLDLQKHRPEYICVEVRDVAAVEAALTDHYQRVEILSQSDAYSDILYRRTDLQR